MTWLLDYYNYRVVLLYLDQFMNGLKITLIAAGVSLVLSVLLGALLAIVLIIRPRFIARIADGYTAVVRATPLLVQIYLIYYGLPSLIPAARGWSELYLGIAALTFHNTPYMAEIIRSGIESVPTGQFEGSKAIGLKTWQSFYLVIMPQAFVNTLPPLLGQAAVLIKDTSLLSIISVSEFLSAGILLNSDRVLPNESFLTIAAGYLLIYAILLMLSHALERRLGVHRRRARA